MKLVKVSLFVALVSFTASLSPVLAEANIKKGKRVFKKCKVCHSIKENAKAKIGPNLYGIIGRKIATMADYKYSKAMSGADFIWTEEKLKSYLEKPKAMFKKTKMIFPGLKKEKDRINLIAYLKNIQKK
jgi:cytochrome c